MSSYHPQKGLVNRYWKRPKPHIYECNMRDAERFYKDSYNQYLQTKHFTTENRSKPNDIEDEFATKWTLNRMNSRIDSHHDPLRKESSLTGYSGDYGRADREGSRSRVTFARHDSLVENGSSDPRTSYRSSSQVQPAAREMSPVSQLDNVESRLERIRKLREELGLPSEITVEDSSSSGARNRSCLRKSAHDTSTETTGYRNETSQNAYGRNNNRSQGNDSSSDNTYESRYSQRSDRPPRAARNGDISDSYSSSYNTNSDTASRSYLPVDDSGDKYSTTSRDSKYRSYDKYSSSSNNKSNKYSDGDYSFESSNPAATSSRSSRSSKYNDESFSRDSKPPRGPKVSSSSNDDYAKYDDDDDDLVSNLRKKFPTSDEILERIKKIDSDL